ncbi:MAG: hypothetical protein R3E68_21790 [Burkholderiaceae bacterium]
MFRLLAFGQSTLPLTGRSAFAAAAGLGLRTSSKRRSLFVTKTD